VVAEVESQIGALAKEAEAIASQAQQTAAAKDALFK
jgi:uncharacterized small protein (DUF1192 family)